MSLVRIDAVVTVPGAPAIRKITFGMARDEAAQLRSIRYSLSTQIGASLTTQALAWTGNLVNVATNLDNSLEAVLLRGLFLMMVFESVVTATGTSGGLPLTKQLFTDLKVGDDIFWFTLGQVAATGARMELEYDIVKVTKSEKLFLRNQGGLFAERTLQTV